MHLSESLQKFYLSKNEGLNSPFKLFFLTILSLGDSKILAVDLIQGACSPGSSQPRSLEPTTENTGQQHIPLRKTQSDLEYSVPPSPEDPIMHDGSCHSDVPKPLLEWPKRFHFLSFLE